jgi:hypothetical protein
MGIRIKKALCFALADLKVGKSSYNLEDERFQDWTKQKDGELYEKPDRVFPDFLNWILDERNQDEILQLLAQANGPDQYSWIDVRFGILSKAMEWAKLSDAEKKQIRGKFHTDFAYQPEYGMSNVFGIIPPEQVNFYRNDDMIDYYEAGCSAKNKIQWLDARTGRCGIYPNSAMIRIPGSTPIALGQQDLLGLSFTHKLEGKAELPPQIMGGDFNRLIGKWDKKQPPLVSEEIVKQLKTTYRPRIHASVLLWTHYLQLFNDWSKTVNQLRPCVYTYWS